MLQYVHLVSNVMYMYMLPPFDVGYIYLLDVNKYIHLVSGGIHSTFPEILLWSTTEQVTGNYRYKNILFLFLLYKRNVLNVHVADGFNELFLTCGFMVIT